MPTSRRHTFASVRLCLVFIALCLALAHLEVAQRQWDGQTAGLPNPFFPRDPLPPSSRLPFLGISVDPANITASERETFFQGLADSGFGWVRVRVAWDRIELAPRDFAWETLDRTLDALIAADLTPVLLLDGSPAWARAPNDRRRAEGPLAPPANLAAFSRFARTVADRYGERVRYYQIWDEPNIAPHWGARLIEPVDYARMLKAASNAIRATDPGAYILLAALAPTADRGHLALDESYFLNRVYAAGAAPYFDAVAIQPFGFADTPNAPATGIRDLNFQRTRLIRQTMLDAGDGDKPLWLMRFGWNRSPSATWRSVSPEMQQAYTLEAIRTAYTQWPWVVAMGWPAAELPPDHPDAGFTLTPELRESFRTTATTLLTQRRPPGTAVPPISLWTPIALWWLAVGILLWRGVAAARRLPWQQWGAQWAARPAWQQGLAWATLLLLYYFAVWPPLLLLCAIVAALGFLVQPRLGLALALLLLPFYAYHKEFDWLGRQWQIPPTQAVLLCLLPAIWRYRPLSLPQDRWSGIVLGWLVVMLLGATGVWYWPAFWTGMLNLVIVPLSLFLLIRAWAITRATAHTLILALVAGGVLVGGIGLVDWLQGRGTAVDGMLRLTGLGFSSNHTALYLIRTFAICIGLTLAAHGPRRWLWALWAALSGVTLLLTGSRGAILLGIPVGALFLFSRQNLPLPSRRRIIGLVLVVGSALALLTAVWWDRLANIGTMFARIDGWIVALYLWFDHFLFGVGPEGFWWTFPAQMWLASDADPNLRHPHLIWLEFATSGGLLALIWLGVVIALLYQWVRVRQVALSWVQVGLLTGLIAAFAHAQVDAFQALSELAGWNWAALALLLALDQIPPISRIKKYRAQ